MNFTVDVSLAGLRLDQGLARLFDQHSRSRLQEWILDGRLELDGVVVKDVRRRLLGGELGRLIPPDLGDETHQAEDIELDCVFEDESIVVIDKPAGLVVHPGSGNSDGTLLNALLHHAPQVALLPRAGIVHRLDKDTSGLLVVAKTLEAQTDLVRQLSSRSVKRQYLALVQGLVPSGGVINAPIGRHPTQRTRMAVVGNGKPSITHYRIVQRFDECTLVQCSLETGRTHQIRVHMASIGFPLVGDPVYGGRRPRGPIFHRQALHAQRLGLIHPLTRQPLEWKCPLPEDFSLLLQSLTHPYEDEGDDMDDEGDWEVIYVRDE